MSHLGSLGETAAKNRGTVRAQTILNEPGWGGQTMQKKEKKKRLACFSAWGWTSISALVSSLPARPLPKKAINHGDTRETDVDTRLKTEMEGGEAVGLVVVTGFLTVDGATGGEHHIPLSGSRRREKEKQGSEKERKREGGESCVKVD